MNISGDGENAVCRFGQNEGLSLFEKALISLESEDTADADTERRRLRGVFFSSQRADLGKYENGNGLSVMRAGVGWQWKG